MSCAVFCYPLFPSFCIFFKRSSFIQKALFNISHSSFFIISSSSRALIVFLASSAPANIFFNLSHGIPSQYPQLSIFFSLQHSFIPYAQLFTEIHPLHLNSSGGSILSLQPILNHISAVFFNDSLSLFTVPVYLGQQSQSSPQHPICILSIILS